MSNFPLSPSIPIFSSQIREIPKSPQIVSLDRKLLQLLLFLSKIMENILHVKHF